MRHKSIQKYVDMGPPDLCYLEIEEHKKGKFLKKSEPGIKRGYYHYVYGVDTSSSACVAAYVTDCINEHTSSASAKKSLKNKLFNKAEEAGVVEKVLKGTFCIYDIVTQRDVRVEITIPGGTQVYALDQFSDSHHEIINILEWNNVFMSSVLRSLDSQNLPCPTMRVL